MIFFPIVRFAATKIIPIEGGSIRPMKGQLEEDDKLRLFGFFFGIINIFFLHLSVTVVDWYSLNLPSDPKP